MNAIITVIGKDSVGILANISNECAKYNVNITDVSQTILKEYFTMIMIGNIDNISISFTDFIDEIKKAGSVMNLEVNVMHEELFNSMHKI